jgi:hemolysin D
MSLSLTTLTLTAKQFLAWTQRPASVLPEAMSFQSHLAEIIDEPPPGWMRVAMFLVVFLLAALILLASLLHVDIVVGASGHLAADQPTTVPQPMERGTIRELRVRAGDVVTKGQILAMLDPTFSQADLVSLTAQKRSLIATLRRLEAELKDEPIWPPQDPDAAVLSTLYRERQVQYVGRLLAIDEAIARGEANYRTADNNSAMLHRQFAVAQDVEAIRSQLYAIQVGSKLLYLDSLSQRLHSEREYQGAINRLAEGRHEIDAKRAERDAFVGDWRGDLLQDVVRTRAELAKIEDSLVKATCLYGLVVVTAPEDGVVLELAARSVGSVLREADAFITVLPLNAPLIAEVMVGSHDVGYVRAGDAVVINVDAFPYQRHGLLRGTLRSIGQASVSGERQAGQDLATASTPCRKGPASFPA